MLCRRCNFDKEADAFPPNKAYASGHSTWCRECHKQANRDWYKKNKVKHSQKSKAWRAAIEIDGEFYGPEIDRLRSLSHGLGATADRMGGA